MSAQSGLVRLSPPAWAVWDHQVTILDCWQMGKQLMVPSHAIDIDFHDAQVRHRRGEMSAHHGAQVAVEIVRRYVDLVSLGRCSDLHRLPDAIPHGVDNGDIHRLLAEIGQEFAQAGKRFTRADRMGAVLANVTERLRVTAVDLNPEN